MSVSESVKRLFTEALERPPAERSAYLDRACGDDAALRAAVADLLDLHEGAPRFLVAPTAPPPGSPAADAAPPTTAAANVDETAGSRIGPYKLLQPIGEGGFGTVFMAEQEAPVRRRVALKIIKAGMDTKQVIARFDAERQALAMMDHPNIARVLDAGATDAGRPYFVMELVRGESITAYCDRNHLAISDRLELFTQVCRAVQHAHQKGVIHRDIKPSNVLVTSTDGKAVPKVIDFGIAKATSARLTEKTLFTEHCQLIGTPEYMSPEQAETTASDVDTRSDVYSLGVLLYELLTGALPFDSKRLRSAAFAEIQRIIREEDPPTPSVRLSRFDALPSVAARRQIEPARLTRLLRGDLDCIVMKCLEKDRTRRYETADALAHDLLRYERGEPILAVPQSALYRLRKFVRRHRMGVTLGSSVAVALVLGIVGTSLGMVWALRAEARAHREAQRAGQAETAAEDRAAELERVAEFQASQFAGLDVPRMGATIRSEILDQRRRGSPTPAPATSFDANELERALTGTNFTTVALNALYEAVFERALAAAEREFSAQPLVRARLLHTIAVALREIGLLDRAMAPQTRALELRERLLGASHVDTLSSINSLGLLLQRRGRLAEAEPYVRQALDQSRVLLGEEHPLTLTAASNMGLLRKNQARFAEAEECYQRVLETRRRLLGDEHPDVLLTMRNLGALYRAAGRHADAEPLQRSVLESSRRALGDDHPDTIASINNLGLLLQYMGRLSDAEPLGRETVERVSRVQGEDHPHTLVAVNNLGMLLRQMGRLAEAEPYARHALERMRRVLGDDHSNTMNAINNLASLLRMQGNLAEAELLVREGLERRRRGLGPDHIETLDSLNNLGIVLRELGRLDEAERLGAEAVGRGRTALPPGHWLLGVFLMQHAESLVKLGRLADATQALHEAHTVLAHALGPTHSRVAEVENALIAAYDAWHASEPQAGHDATAAEWRTKQDRRKSAPQASATQPARPGNE